MPLGAARALTTRRQEQEPFVVIPAFTPASSGSAVASLVSNTINIAIGDLIVVVFGASQDSVITPNVPTGNWTSPPTFTSVFANGHQETVNTSHIGMATATADTNQTAEDVTQTWPASMFGPVVGLFVIPGGASVRQLSSVGTKNGGTSTLTCTFSVAPLSTSLGIAVTHGHNSTLFGSAPVGWTASFNVSPSSNSRAGMSSRLMPPTSQQFAGFSSSGVAIGRMVEFQR